jgi:two-component system, sensor histidine kinase
MNAHGGQLCVTSSGIPGEGCIFGMELKVNTVTLIAPQMLQSTSLDASETITGSRETVAVTVSSGHHVSLGTSRSLSPSLSTDEKSEEKSEEKEESPYDLVHALVVDDSPMNRKMLMMHLKGFGIRNVSQACNGLEGVQAVEERMGNDSVDKLFDIVFMDCMMPVMDGREATKKIRKLGYEGPIISVTGNGLPEDVRDIMSCGSTKLLVKPVTADGVESVLRGK